MANAIVDGSGNLIFTGGGATGQITKGVSPNQVPASALGTNYVQPGYTGIAPPPPPPWVNPVANADSISGGTVGQALTINAATLLANDTVDSRSSLSILTVQSAVGCTVSLNVATQVITMTPTQVSPVSFTYTVTDTQSNTSTATVTFPSVAPAVVANNPPKPDLGPGLDATNSTLLQISAPGTYTLTAGVDYRVQFTAVLTDQVYIIGGRKVHIGWGPTTADYGGQITSTLNGFICLLVEDMSQSCWVEGMILDKAGSQGHALQIRPTTKSFPVYVINSYIVGGVPIDTNGSGTAISVRGPGTAVACPKLTIDGVTFIAYGVGIGRSSEGSLASITQLVCNHSYGHYGVNASRLIGKLYEVPASASFTDTWAVDDANPTAAIAPLVSGGVSTTDANGNLNFTGSATGQISKGTSPNQFASAKVGTNYVQPGYTAVETPVPPPPPPPPSGKKPIYLFTPVASTLTSAIMARYNAITAYNVYWHSTFDTNTDGRFDGSASVSGYSSTAVTGLALDWEAVTSNYGATTIYVYTGGRGTDSTATTARAEGLKCLKYYQAQRPNLLVGYYYCPCPLISELSNYIKTGAIASAWATLPANALSITSVADCMFPSCYVRSATGSSNTFNGSLPLTLTTAAIKLWQNKNAELALKASEATNWACKVFPFVSWTHYSYGAENLTPVSLSEGYNWHKGIGEVVYNGRSIDGISIWDSGSSTPLTEAELKTTYQAVNGLPFDPNMPRP